ncbi:sialate O-acetylesterase [Lentisphaera marina]|uniref:sialate O-acetylesterase n=1 Tax=Lentisphaera marina TaxID=1111041 RepID=UPI002366D4B2|nr:sialate O-acetylesterase [Lentisphaera marina]MDD7985279.1 sialate O-acetylesterase [Lentisphaera marina]
MRTMRYLALTFFVIASGLVTAGEQAKHLIILSGQSNMNGKVRESDIIKPMVEKEFGQGSVIAVRHAAAGSSIAYWLEKTIDAYGNEITSPGTVYPKLMSSVKAAIKDKEITSVTFIWMQGESDVLLNPKPDWKKDKSMPAEIYQKNFFRLLDRIKADLKLKDINVVIGRLSDYHMHEKMQQNKVKSDAWIAIRDLQVKIAETLPHGAWVNTDDLNDGLQTRRVKNKGTEIIEVSNDLHYTDKGYKEFSKRLAKASQKLIRQSINQGK